MITMKHGLPGQGMTFTQRRRLINIIWALLSNSVLPFILGFVVALISVTYAFTATITTFEKTGFGVCVQPELPISAANKD